MPRILPGGTAKVDPNDPALRAALVPASSTQATQWSTSSDGTTRLLAQTTPAAFGPLTSFGWRPLTVDPGKTHQEITGFGVAITGATAQLLQTKLTDAQRAALLDEVFNPARGNISIVRVSIGASDFDAVRYTYDDQPNGVTDPQLTSFSIGADQQYRIETLKQILQINPRVRIVAAPWSPPPWMKADPTTGMLGSALLSAYYQAYANYFVKFLQAYKSFGIDIWALTPQNEPNQVFSWPGMAMTAAQQVTFIGQYLGPAMDAAGFTTKILCYDDSWSPTGESYAATVYNDATAGPYVEGAAWHWYGGDPTSMRNVARKFPTKGNWMTEACGGLGSTIFTLDTAMKRLFIGSMRNEARAVVLWNLALDENNGPTNRQVSSEKILPVVTVPSNGSGTLVRDISYYALMQTSRFVPAGSLRVTSASYDDGIITVAYRSPTGQVTLVAYNTTGAAISTMIVDARSSNGFPVTIPAGDVATFVWQGVGQGAAASGIAVPAAPTLAAAAGAGRNTLTITPPASAAPLSGYTVTRGTVAGTRTLLTSLAPAATSYTDRAVTPGTPYFYAVTADNAGGRSAVSTEVSATPSPATVPAAPTVTVAPGNRQNAVTVTVGDDGGSAITAVKIYRGTTAGVSTAGAPIATLAGGGIYTDSGLNNGTAYYYRATAVNAIGTSADSAEVSATPVVVDNRSVATPATATQPALWLRGDQVGGTNGAAVTLWPDFTSNARNAVVPSGAGTPTLISSAVNSLPAVSFNKTTPQRLVAPQPVSAENVTILVVARYPTLTTSILVGGATADAKVTGSVNSFVTSGGVVNAQVAPSGASIGSGSNLTANTFGIAAISWDTAAASHVIKSVVNGGTVGTVTPSAYTAAASTGLGIGGVGTDDATVDVAEVIVFPAVLSDADRHTWTVYLGQVYGITVGAN